MTNNAISRIIELMLGNYCIGKKGKRGNISES